MQFRFGLVLSVPARHAGWVRCDDDGVGWQFRGGSRRCRMQQWQLRGTATTQPADRVMSSRLVQDRQLTSPATFVCMSITACYLIFASKMWIVLKWPFLITKCLHGTTPPYRQIHSAVIPWGRSRLRSTSSSSLIVHRPSLSTVGNRALSVVATPMSWTNCHATLHLHSLRGFCRSLKTRLFSRSFPEILYWLWSDLHHRQTF